MREWWSGPWWRQAGLAVAIGLAAAALGPYGTGDRLTPAEAAAYWVAVIALGWIQFTLASILLRRHMTLARPAQLAATIALGTLPLAIELTLVNGTVFGGDATLRTLATTYLQAGLVATLILVPMSLIRAAPMADIGEPAAPPSPSIPGQRFFARIPATLGGRLLALEMEDHYLRIHTESGSALILHRISDAVAELEGVDGWRVHRSWWVAAEAVAGVRREKGGRALLVLTNGLVVPVSRSAAPALRERLRTLAAA